MDLPDIVTADESNFDFQVLAHSEYVPVLVFFWAPWNLVCLKLDPYLEKLVEGYGGRFRLARVNVDENPQLSRKYQVRTVPTIKSFQDGRVSHQSEGINTEGGVLAFVRTVIPGPENLLIEKALQLLRSGDYAEAEQACLEVIEEFPTHPRANLLLAKSLIWQGEYLDALPLLSHFPPSPEYQRSEILYPLVEQLIMNDDRPNPGANPLDLVYRRAIRLIKSGNFPAALDGLLGLIQKDRKYQGGIPRLVMLGVFELLGEEHKITREYRPQLANSLF